jgi:hypothetical protein
MLLQRPPITYCFLKGRNCSDFRDKSLHIKSCVLHNFFYKILRQSCKMNVLSFESISWLSNLHLGSSAICLTLGVAFHLAIQKFDLDYYIHYFLAGCTSVWAILIVTYVAFAQIDFQSAIHLSCVNAIIFALGLIISIATYRLFLHRLNHFPGPCGAAVSRFYLVSCIFRSLQYHILLDDWHRRYGDFVRTGMVA